MVIYILQKPLSNIYILIRQKNSLYILDFFQYNLQKRHHNITKQRKYVFTVSR